MNCPATLLIASILYLNPFIINAQPAGNQPYQDRSVEYPKIYLHTDREVYFPGDSIWFKAYYLDGKTQRLYPGAFSMYTDLMNDQGHSVDSQVLLIEDGVSAGKIEIPDSAGTGNYALRAFTEFQNQLGEDTYFYKRLKVTSVVSRMEQASANSSGTPPVPDIAFLPEGGILLEGQSNTVGIKAVDQNGWGAAISGEILDSKGAVVSRYATVYKGMGSFQFTPLRGESYHATLTGYPDYYFSFNEIEKEGIKIAFDGESEENLLFRVTTNSESFLNANYIFTILHRGEVIFRQEYIQHKREVPLKVERAALPAGINRFVLLDNRLRPVSERLHFSGNIEVNDIQIIPDRENYRPRSKVEVAFLDEEELGGQAISDLSVTVVDAYATGDHGPAQNILSWLLIGSELKGNIESPADFFVNDDDLSSTDKLNLLMLTQGWSRYIWTSLMEGNANPQVDMTEGITIEGTVKHSMTKRPIANGSVELNIWFNGQLLYVDEKTDKSGRFLFDNIIFTDTASLFIQASNRKGKRYTVIDLDPVFHEHPALSETYLPVDESTIAYSSGIYEQKYYSDLDLKNFALESGSILLEGVTVTRKKPVTDGHFRLYPKPYNSLEVTVKDYGYRNVADYLQGRVAGLTVVGNSISMRGPGSFTAGPPLFLLDGTAVDEDLIMSITMSEIELVEVLKNPDEAGIFGTRAGNGVISVFTRRGGASIGSEFVQGTLARRIAGYSPFREVYSPAYTAENIESERPDHRLTLYWDPDIITTDGHASVSFFTSDDITRYRIYVEGITQTGEVCLGTSELTVTRE